MTTTEPLLAAQSPQQHPFIRSPHRTVLTLSIPVLVSLIAEPLTGLVDTAFVARLGAESLAALGVGTAALSSVFWVFGFLGVGSQTEVAQALGNGRPNRAARVAGLAILSRLNPQWHPILLQVLQSTGPGAAFPARMNNYRRIG